jgi:hypothetical protein
MTVKSIFFSVMSWTFGTAVFAVGLLNMFWGNDTAFGVFLLLLSFAYFPQVNHMIRKNFGFSIPPVVKIILAVFIIWVALGVGELFPKVELMLDDINSSK